MPEDEKTSRSGSQAEEGKGSRKPARKGRAKAAGGKGGGSARKPTQAKAESGKAPARKRAAKPKAEPKPKPAEKAAPPPPVVVRASARYVRTAPRKARLVADQVRGLHIDRARALLQFSPRSAARDIAKLIDSAAANAENNHELVADDMRIHEITVDEGPTLRRYRPRALGRATRINKRTSHISVALSPEEES
jgi:ribosomal protein L22